MYGKYLQNNGFQKNNKTNRNMHERNKVQGESRVSMSFAVDTKLKQGDSLSLVLYKHILKKVVREFHYSLGDIQINQNATRILEN